MWRCVLCSVLVALMLTFGSRVALGDGVWEGQITDENDDVEQQASSMYMDSSDLEMVDDGNTHVGLRFLNVAVPPGSAISSAYIEFQVDEVETDLPADLIIYGDLTADAPAFDSGDPTNVSDRPATAAQVAWAPPHWDTVGDKKQTVDISSVIEEIVNQAGWKSGNALVIIIIDNPDSSVAGFRNAVGGPGDDSALLHIEYGPAVKAKQPNPAYNEADVLRDSDLSWLPGAFAATHDVYLGTSFDDVDAASRANPMDVLISQGQTASTLELDRLEFGQTYYWRVDEVNSAPDNSIFKGDVWNFTVEPFVYPVENIIATAYASEPGSGPENTVNGSGLDASDGHSVDSMDMWQGNLPSADSVWIQYEFDQVYKLYQMLVWNYNVQFEAILGFGLKDVTIEYSENGTDWTALGDFEFAQATSAAGYTANTTIDFGGLAAKYVKLTVHSNWGFLPQYGLSEVRFLQIPAHARLPQPAVGETEVAVGAVLAWRAGREAAAHEIYLSTDEQAVIDGTALADTVATNSYAPADLQFGTDYYWRVDEVNDAEAISRWSGGLWNFSTEEYALIDDFESYDDEENRIYDTWLDGWVNNSGSTVGYFESPFAEKSIVHGGGQSMPLSYDNVAGALYSEAEFDLGGANLNSNGADSLRLFVYGQAPGFVENADGTILMNAIGTDIWDTGDQFRYAYKSLTGDGSMIARVDNLDGSPSTWAKVGVMIRQSTGTGSPHSFMCMTGGDGNGASWQGRLDEGLASESADVTDAVAPPYWVRIDRSGSSLTGFVSPDGETWTQVGEPRDIAMDDPVLIGLAVTSHNANQATSAQFSNISSTGNVTGAWQVAEIGAAQPEGNTPESVYVALEDSTGKVAVVTNPDLVLSARSGWTEWVIPYADLTGVNLGNVRTLYVGIGDRDNPTSGGTGTVFIDDVGFGRSAADE